MLALARVIAVLTGIAGAAGLTTGAGAAVFVPAKGVAGAAVAIVVAILVGCAFAATAATGVVAAALAVAGPLATAAGTIGGTVVVGLALAAAAATPIIPAGYAPAIRGTFGQGQRGNHKSHCNHKQERQPTHSTPPKARQYTLLARARVCKSLHTKGPGT